MPAYFRIKNVEVKGQNKVVKLYGEYLINFIIEKVEQILNQE